MRTESQPGMGRIAALLAVTMLAAMVAIGYRVQTARATGTFNLGASTYNVTEGNAVNIVVNRTGGSISEDTSILLTFTAGTADEVDDYPLQNPQVSFFASSQTTSRTYSFSTNEDGANEGTETVFVAITVFEGDGTLGTTTSATISIVDDDGPAKYSFASGSASVTEVNDNSYAIQVVREGDTSQSDHVSCRLRIPGDGGPGTATGAGDDYTFADQAFTFSAGETTKNCIIDLDEDVTTEPSETIILQLFNGGDFNGGAGTYTEFTLTILDNDGVGTMQFSSSQYTVNEDDGTASISVTRTGGSTGAASAFCRTVVAGSTATEADDYTETDDQVSWDAGESGTRTCTVPITNDGTLESQELVNLVLDTPVGAAIGGQSTADLFINDDDGDGSLQFTSTSYSGTENGGAITLTITRTGSSAGEVSVDIQTTTSGSTATINTDYTPNSTTLTWAAGNSASKTFTVSPVDDAIVEGSEHLHVTLTNPTGGASLGTPSTAQVFILDNESPLPVISSVSPAAGTILGGTAVTISGANFTGATSVTFGGSACTSLIVVSSVTITCVTPAHTGGTVEVVVNTPSGSNTTTGSNNDFTYTGGPTISSLDPATGLASGSTVVTITGTNFTPSGMTVKVDGLAVQFTFIDTVTVVAVAPPHSAGVVDVSITTPGGTTPNTVADDFTYTGASNPVVTLLSPSSGPIGTTVVITGSALTGATLVTFGGVAATFTVNSDAQITASVPAGTPAGTVDVRVTTASGTSANTAADNFNNTSASATISYTLFFRFTLIVWTGPNGISALAALRGQETPDNPATNNVQALVGAIWRFDASSQTFKGYFPGSDGIPGANDFTTLSSGVGYFVALLNPGTVTWTTLGAN